MELKNTTHNFLWKIISIVTVAIMFIPMMYSLFYLGAFWDPYGSLNKVPVAFVNLDKPYIKDGKSYTLGKDVEKNLKSNDSMKWEFVSYNKAKEGVEGTSYYAMIVIPEDFSQKIADSTSGNFNKPNIIYEANKGRNFIFSQLSLKAAESIQTQVDENIAKETSKVLVDKLYDVKGSIKDASDAQDKINDGSKKLLDGSNELSNNLVTAANGSDQLKNGLDTAVNGISSLENGLLKLAAGGDALSNGLDTAANGSDQLKNGLGELAGGEKQISDGLDTVTGGLDQFKANLSQSNSDMSSLVQGTAGIDQAVGSMQTQVSQGNDTITKNLDTAAGAVDSIGQNSNTASQLIAEAMDDFKKTGTLSSADLEMLTQAQAINSKVGQSTSTISSSLRAGEHPLDSLAAGLTQLKPVTEKVAAGTKLASDTVTKSTQTASAAIDQIKGGITSKLKPGSEAVYNGLQDAASKTGDLENGLVQMKNGSGAMITGLNSAASGSTDLKTGLQTAASKTGELSSGLSQLSDGSKSLNSGLSDLNDGTGKLKDGLNDGYTKINNNLKFTSSDMSKFVSDPVKLTDKSINNVKKYGEGLAPYFISLSLWLGAMFVNIILTVIDKLGLAKNNKFLNSFAGKFALGAVLVCIQAIILAFSLRSGLGLDAVKTSYLYLNNIFTSLVFFSFMYGLSAAFGIMSTPISFVLLILQLSSCAGTFPIETAPTFYRVVNQYIPMTYTVKVVRMVLSGINHSDLMQNLGILSAFMFISLIGGFLIKTLRERLKTQILAKKSAENAA